MVIYGYRVPVIFSVLLWAALWEFIGNMGWVFILPPIIDVGELIRTQSICPPLTEEVAWRALNAPVDEPVKGILCGLVEILPKSNFHAAIFLSFKAFFWGMAFAVTGGIVLGFLMGRVKLANEVLGMWVNIFSSAPLSSLVPVIMLLFGIGQTTMIVTVVLFALWIITLDTYAGVRHISPSLIEMGRSFGASRWQLYSKVLFWAAMPEILAGIRMGLIRAVKGVVIGQMLVAVTGMGLMLATYSRSFLFGEFWAMAFVLFTFALGLSALIGKLEQRIEYYAGSRE
jgi:NitT/TauT family transport system permease protein